MDQGVAQIIAAFVGIVGIYITAQFGFKKYKRESYNQHITSERIKWLNALKDEVAEFNEALRLVELQENNRINLKSEESKDEEKDKINLEVKLIEQLTRSYSKIIFALNPIDNCVDKAIIASASAVYLKASGSETIGLGEVADKGKDEGINELRKKFLEDARVLFKAEWDIIKEEAQKGLLNNEDKKKRYEEIKEYRKEYSKKHNQQTDDSSSEHSADDNKKEWNPMEEESEINR